VVETSPGAAGGPGQLRINVRDLGSTNGVHVDGHRVTSVPVRGGSTVTIGKTEIHVVVTEEDVDV
jgi:pSer/pThr/pTyr-binding forkhead associated (FHA) protein